MEKNNDSKNGKVVSFINMKGGVGKTTLTINIGYALVKEFKKRVLMIDMDPQFNATEALMTKFSTIDKYDELRKCGFTIVALLVPQAISMIVNERDNINDKPIANIEKRPLEIIHTLIKDFDLIPGDLSLTEYPSSVRGSEKKLDKYVEENRLRDKYDYILIDTPATYSIYSQASLLASDFFIVPVAPDVFSKLGYSLLEKTIKDDLVLENSKVKNLGIIFTKTDSKRRKRSNIMYEDMGNAPRFEETLKESEYINTGKLETLMYDMSSCKANIVDLTTEFIEKV